MESGEWRVENGDWRMESKGLRVESGEQQSIRSNATASQFEGSQKVLCLQRQTFAASKLSIRKASVIYIVSKDRKCHVCYAKEARRPRHQCEKIRRYDNLERIRAGRIAAKYKVYSVNPTKCNRKNLKKQKFYHNKVFGYRMFCCRLFGITHICFTFSG